VREADQRQIDGIEYEFDGHEDNDGIATGQHANDPNNKEQGTEG
jgi:hypothetical protein